MDIYPHVNLIRSLRSERIDYVSLIGEGIDNAFDADATLVEIVLDAEKIRFADNGCGITRDNIAKLFSLGAHGSLQTTKLGRFGIGIKYHAVRCGDVLRVDSISKDGRVEAEANWRNILRSGLWHMEDPRWFPVAIDNSTGTTVVIAALQPGPKVNFEKINEEVALRFYPALAEGRRVRLNGHQVERLVEPAMTDIIEREIGLSDGRSARLRAGILTAPSRLSKVHVGYEHRVILASNQFGCGQYAGLNKMLARIQLLGRYWHISRFKDELTNEEEREELEDAALEILRPILEKCNTATLSARVTHIANLVNEMIPAELAARPKRGKGKATGPSRHNEKPGHVAPEKSELGGPARTRRPPTDQLLITFDGSSELHGVGEFQPGRPHRVNLSRDDPYVARLLEQRDVEVGALSIYALAMALFEEGRQGYTRAPELPFEPFGKRIGGLLAIQDLASIIKTVPK